MRALSFLPVLGVTLYAAAVPHADLPQRPIPARAYVQFDAAQQQPFRGMDHEMARIAREEVPGFAGYVIGEDGTVEMYLVDPGQAHRAQVAIRRHLERAPGLRLRRDGPPFDPRQFRGQVRPARYDYAQLLEWKEAAYSLFSLSPVNALNIDEHRNRVVIGVTDPQDASFMGTLNERLRELGVPRDAVEIEREGRPEDLVRVVALSDFDAWAGQDSTLRSRFRPVPGGVLVSYFHPTRTDSVRTCTMGVNIDGSAGVIGGGTMSMLVNSHCTRWFNERDGRPHWQPLPQAAGWGDSIANEVSDRAPATSGCPSGWPRCRYSDAALSGYHSRSTAQFGWVARAYPSSISLNVAAPRFRIVGKASYPVRDQELDKIGAATGWSWGNVLDTCKDKRSGSDTLLVLRCQDLVQLTSDQGDSGGPVFSYNLNTQEITIYGILWGRDPVTNTAVMSAVNNIEHELGTFTVR